MEVDDPDAADLLGLDGRVRAEALDEQGRLASGIKGEIRLVARRFQIVKRGRELVRRNLIPSNRLTFAVEPDAAAVQPREDHRTLGQVGLDPASRELVFGFQIVQPVDAFVLKESMRGGGTAQGNQEDRDRRERCSRVRLPWPERGRGQPDPQRADRARGENQRDQNRRQDKSARFLVVEDQIEQIRRRRGRRHGRDLPRPSSAAQHEKRRRPQQPDDGRVRVRQPFLEIRHVRRKSKP